MKESSRSYSFGIRLPFHEKELLVARAIREEKKPTTLAAELVGKALRRKPTAPGVDPDQVFPPAPGLALLPPAPTQSPPPPLPPAPPPERVVIRPITIFPKAIQKTVGDLSAQMKISVERSLIELVASVLGSLTEDALRRVITGDPTFTTVDLMKTLEGISDGSLKPVVTFEEVEADLAAGPMPPTTPSAFPTASQAST
jgi:hypothetical protein